MDVVAAQCRVLPGGREFPVELLGTNDTRHKTLVITEEGETDSGGKYDSRQQLVAVETTVAYRLARDDGLGLLFALGAKHDG